MGLILEIVSGVIEKGIEIVASLGIAELVIDLINAVGKFLVNLAKALGAVDPDETLDDFGAKAMQAEEQGIKPENFNSVEDYIKTVSKMELDPEFSAKLKDVDKAKKATELLTSLAAEKYGDVTVQNLFKTFEEHGDYFTPERTDAICEALKDDDRILDAINGVIGGTEKNFIKRQEQTGLLEAIEKKISPSLSDVEVAKVLTTI